MCAIDAIGYQAWSDANPGETRTPAQVVEDVIRVTNPTGHIGLIGVYFPQDPGGVDAEAKRGRFSRSLGHAWEKGLSIEMGQAPVKRYKRLSARPDHRERCQAELLVSHRLPPGSRAGVLREVRSANRRVPKGAAKAESQGGVA
jgi:glutathione-independent formaldehyde dehydrogenase